MKYTKGDLYNFFDEESKWRKDRNRGSDSFCE